jgi:hypothetical protein
MIDWLHALINRGVCSLKVTTVRVGNARGRRAERRWTVRTQRVSDKAARSSSPDSCLRKSLEYTCGRIWKPTSLSPR